VIVSVKRKGSTEISKSWLWRRGGASNNILSKEGDDDGGRKIIRENI